MVVAAARPRVASACAACSDHQRLGGAGGEHELAAAVTDEAVEAPVMPSMAVSTSETVSVEPAPMPIVTLPLPSVVTVVEPVEKVMVLPSTVSVEPLVMAVARSSEVVPAVATSSVAAVIATGGAGVVVEHGGAGDRRCWSRACRAGCWRSRR